MGQYIGRGANAQCGKNAGLYQCKRHPERYDNKMIESPYRAREKGLVPQCEHLHIHEWDELIAALEELE